MILAMMLTPPPAPMKVVFTLLACLLPLLLSGCGDSGYEKRSGVWHYDDQPIRRKLAEPFKPIKGAFARDAEVGYYRGSPIAESDGPTFEPLDDHYARDKLNAYFCDTYRKGQEVYTHKYSRVILLEGVAPGSFRVLKDRYARDDTKLFFEGGHVPVKDINTFEILSSDFQRDRVTGYYMRRPIPGSDGSTFAVVDDGYSKDKAGIYYSSHDRDDGAMRYKTLRIAGASPASFVAKGAGYAVDAQQAYHSGKVLTQDVASFKVLPSLYARTSAVIYFDGKPVVGADAATFAVLEQRDGRADAKDARVSYQRGERVVPDGSKPAGG